MKHFYLTEQNHYMITDGQQTDRQTAFLHDMQPYWEGIKTLWNDSWATMVHWDIPLYEAALQRHFVALESFSKLSLLLFGCN